MIQNIFARLVLAGSIMLLSACSGGNSSSNPPVNPPPANTSAVLQTLGKQIDPNTVDANVCAGPSDPAITGSAFAARYPASPDLLRTWRSFSRLNANASVQMRSDRTGGLIVAHNTNTGGAMFRVDANGAKSTLSLPYSSTFDVAPDGRVWFVSNGMLSVASIDGKTVSDLASESGIAAPADGLLGSTPLGKIALIAAGANKVYLLTENDSANSSLFEDAQWTRQLRVLTGNGLGGWTVQTVPLFAALKGNDVISAMRSDASDRLLLLLNQPFGQMTTSDERVILWNGSASVWHLDATASWTMLSAKSYSTRRVLAGPHTNYTYTYTLDANDIGVDPSGNILVGGAGAMYSVDTVHGWVEFAITAGTNVDRAGFNGPMGTGAFGSASQMVVDNTGITFYDGQTCQIRRLQGAQLSTLSGPTLTDTSFAGAKFLGINSNGNLLFGTNDLADYRIRPFIRHLASANVSDPQFVPTHLGSLYGIAGRAQCSAYYNFHSNASFNCLVLPASLTGSYLGLNGDTLVSDVPRWPASGSVFDNFYDNILVGSPIDPNTVSYPVINWPGLLFPGYGPLTNGEHGVHVSDGKLYVFGRMWIDPQPAPGITNEPRLYKLDLATGIAAPVAGASIASSSYGNMLIDLAPVLATDTVYVQRRGDGGFWLSNRKEVWLISNAGKLQRIAGTLNSGDSATDGKGNNASFSSIENIRVLPDNRLIVIDKGAHAIRMLTDAGVVTTVVGKLNQKNLALGPLPAGLDTPVDAYPSGHDLFITTASSRNLLQAKGAL